MSDSLVDEVVVVEESDDVEFEIVFTFDESGRLDVEEFSLSRERSFVDALELLSP